MEFEILHTERLLLRKLTPAHYKYIFENYPEEEIRRFLAARTEEEYAKERSRYEGGISTYRMTVVLFQLIDKQTQETFGTCGLHNWYPEHRRAEIGYHISLENYKQKGYMTEAVKAIIDHGFYTMDLNRIDAHISPKNIPSLRLIKKYNFTQEGYLKQHYFINGAHEDSLIFALLRQEYEKAYASILS